MGLLARATGLVVATTASPALGWIWYSRNTHFVPFGTSSPDFTSPASKKVNPDGNKPLLIDHAIRTVPLAQLSTTDQGELTKKFCQGIWAGQGFAYQRRFLERKWRALEGRDDQLWDRRDLESSNYDLGTKITDHFEVIDRTDDKVTVRCGDSPLNKGPRPSDGTFSIEVTKDDQNATFHLKSTFFNSTPQGVAGGQLPSWFPLAHREYTKLWMETSVRRLLK